MLLNWFPLWLGHGDKLWLNLVKRMGAISSLTLSGSLFRPLQETEVIVLVAVQFCLAVFFYCLVRLSLLISFYCLKPLLLGFPKALFLHFFLFYTGLSQT